MNIGSNARITNVAHTRPAVPPWLRCAATTRRRRVRSDLVPVDLDLRVAFALHLRHA